MTKACERLFELCHCYPSGKCGLKVDNEAQGEYMQREKGEFKLDRTLGKLFTRLEDE